jgi:2-methylaconitate cis-trans-isomerase PrpF
VILRNHLPPPDQWPHILPSALGSPDPYRRQLDGMGSGNSPSSKICVLAPSFRPDADVEFTFVQVGVRDGKLRMTGNGGNMLSIVGPVSLDQGLLGSRPEVETDAGGFQTALVRILNTNTDTIIHSRFRVIGEPPRYCPEGDYEMSGVPGKQSKIVLGFTNPAGARTGLALPTGNVIDTLTLPDGDTIEASLVDVVSPIVFVRVSDLGVEDPETLDPSRIGHDESLRARLNSIRGAGASMMGLDPDIQSFPKIVLVFPRPPRDSAVHVKCVALSMGRAQRTVQPTPAMCLGAAVRIPGTIPHELSCAPGEGEAITIGHPSGKLEVGATVEHGQVLSVELHITARVLMIGEVFYRRDDGQGIQG